jgi:hypothetical protein
VDGTCFREGSKKICEKTPTNLGIEEEHGGFRTKAPIFDFDQLSILQLYESDTGWVVDACV